MALNNSTDPFLVKFSIEVTEAQILQIQQDISTYEKDPENRDHVTFEYNKKRLQVLLDTVEREKRSYGIP